MEIIRLAEQKVTAWKNGGGSTREIAVFPEGASIDNFTWRISSADIEKNGPFSIFEGIDRSIALTSGNPVMLSMDQKEPVLLTNDIIAEFPGEQPVISELSGGAVKDFNAMTRRRLCSHKMEKLNIRKSAFIPKGYDFCIVFVIDNALIRCSIQSAYIELNSGDAAVFNSNDGKITLSGCGQLYITVVNMI